MMGIEKSTEHTIEIVFGSERQVGLAALVDISDFIGIICQLRFLRLQTNNSKFVTFSNKQKAAISIRKSL